MEDEQHNVAVAAAALDVALNQLRKTSVGEETIQHLEQGRASLAEYLPSQASPPPFEDDG